MKLPGDLCACGHSRNQHSGYGLGRCLLRGCPGIPPATTDDDQPHTPCVRLTPPAQLEAARALGAMREALADVVVAPGPVFMRPVGPSDDGSGWRPGGTVDTLELGGLW